MTIHHDIALALAVLLVIACVVMLVLIRGGATPETKDIVKDIIGFATTIAVATFAHAQGVKSGAAAAMRTNGNGHSDGGK